MLIIIYQLLLIIYKYMYVVLNSVYYVVAHADTQAVDSLESAKRIKKEMWMKRSSFLGLEEYTNGNASYEHGKSQIKQLDIL